MIKHCKLAPHYMQLNLHHYSDPFSVLADSLMEKFRALVPEAAAVIRDGVTKPVAATDIVIGDLIRLKSGNLFHYYTSELSLPLSHYLLCE